MFLEIDEDILNLDTVTIIKKLSKFNQKEEIEYYVVFFSQDKELKRIQFDSEFKQNEMFDLLKINLSANTLTSKIKEKRAN